MSADSKKWYSFGVAGPWVAMVAAVVLTAKGEFDLAVLAHFAPEIAWMFPVMIDVYVITAFHRRRWADMFIGMMLMIFCQIAVHLLPVYITEGEATPWGLVVAVACIAPIVVVRVKMLTGKTPEEIAAAAKAALRDDDLHAAQAEIAGLRRQVAETRATAETETHRALAEAEARQVAETRAVEAETRIEQAETRAAAEAETRAEIEAAAKAEIDRFSAAAEAADRRAGEQVELARIVEGQLAEARETADRAMVARVTAEQTAAAQIERLTTAAEQIQTQLRERIAQATAAADAANEQATAVAEQVRTLQGQLTEAREYAQLQGAGLARAEQVLSALQAERDEVLAELGQVRTAAANEIEKLRRQLARATDRAEIGGGRQAEISRPATRKSLAAVPAGLAGNLPVVETVSPETVAAVLLARAEMPEATQAELRQHTGISDRTIRKVLKAVPAEIAGEVLELTDGRAA